MKANYMILWSLLGSIIPAISQVTPNSKRFEIKEYIAIDNSGKYSPYYSHGFVENVANGHTAKIFIMPLLELDIKHIKFIDSRGLETTSSNTDVYSISIPITADLSLPNESQKAAIGAALSSSSALLFYYPPILKNSFGGPLINPNAGIFSAQIVAQANLYEQNIMQQQGYINAYNQYRAEIISLSEYEVILKVGNEIIYSERYPGTVLSMANSLDDIAIDRPTEYVKNRIAGGNISINVKYKFRDSKNSYINARLDAGAIVNQFLSEAQESTVSQKSSGWSFLGFGSRRKSMKTRFDTQVDQQYSDQRYSNTSIEMYDADDQMIELFEEAFFPRVAEQKAIENHIASAEKAKQEGNLELQKLHLEYVRALQNNDPNLEVNIGEAVAALAKKDYVGFIANGVRWGNNSGDGRTSFRRVLNSSEMTAMVATWSQTKTVSIQHAVTQKVSIAKKNVLKAHLGLVDGITYESNMLISNGYVSQWKNVKGLIIGPITLGGALHQNNITPGTLITKLGTRSIYSAQSLSDALKNYNPGDSDTVTVIEQIGPNIFQEKIVSITLGAYPKS